MCVGLSNVVIVIANYSLPRFDLKQLYKFLGLLNWPSAWARTASASARWHIESCSRYDEATRSGYSVPEYRAHWIKRRRGTRWPRWLVWFAGFHDLERRLRSAYC